MAQMLSTVARVLVFMLSACVVFYSVLVPDWLRLRKELRIAQSSLGALPYLIERRGAPHPGLAMTELVWCVTQLLMVPARPFRRRCPWK